MNVKYEKENARDSMLYLYVCQDLIYEKCLLQPFKKDHAIYACMPYFLDIDLNERTLIKLKIEKLTYDA